MPSNSNIINPADEVPDPTQPVASGVAASTSSQIINPADEVPEPVVQEPMVKADVQLTPQAQPPIDDSFTGRAKLSLDRDKATAELYSQQMQAGDVGVGNQVLEAATHPIIYGMAKFGQSKLTQQQAADVLQQGTAARKLEEINQQFAKMPNATLLNPVEWTKQAVSNNIVAAAGLGAGLVAIPLTGLSIPAAAGAALAGAVGSMGAKVVGEAFNSNVIDKPNNPNDPNDPFYSRQNQAGLANLNAWQDAGGLVGGGIGGKIGPSIIKPNKTLSKEIIGKAENVLGDIYDENANQAGALLKTAKGLNINTQDLPNNPENFVPAEITDLQKRVQKVTGHAENEQQENILNAAIFRDSAPATTAEFSTTATNQTGPQKQANSAVTDAAFKNTLSTQYNTLQPYWGMLDKHGFIPAETTKVNEAAMAAVKDLTDKNLIGTLYGNNTLSMNYVTKGLQLHANDIANAGPDIIDSMLDSLSTTVNRDPYGPAGIAAQQAYKKIYPVVQEAKANSIKAHLTNSNIMGGNTLTEPEVDILASNIKGAYSGAGQSPTAFNAADGATLPSPDTYGIEAPAGYASNRNFYNKEFAPKPDAIQGYQYTDYIDKITKDMYGSVTDFGNKLINSKENIKSVMDSPEYIKAFGGHAFGKDKLSYQEQKNALDSSFTNASNALQITFGDGIKSGVFPDAMSNADRMGLQRILNAGDANQRNLGGWITGNPDAANILFKFNKSGIENHKTYQEILSDLSTPDKFPITAKSKALEYIKNQEDPRDYKNLVEGATNNFTNQITDLISSGKVDNGAKVIDLANQYKGIFGQDADPILSSAYQRLGLGVANGNKELVAKVRDLIGDNSAVSKKFTNQIIKIQQQMVRDTVNEYNKGFLMKVMENPFNIPKIAIDTLSRVANSAIPILPSANDKRLNKSIGDSLQSRANYEAAKAQIDKEQANAKYQRLMNVFTGGQTAGQQ